MENNIEHFKLNEFVVGIDDADDVIAGKESDYIALCGELWDYLLGDFQNSDYVESDYIKLCDIYDTHVSYRLYDMDALDEYCEYNGITVTDFIERMDRNFDIYDSYFMGTNRYISGNWLSEFGDVDSFMANVMYFIIKYPIGFCRYQHDIEDPKLNEFIEKFKTCVKDKNYWCKE